MPYTITVRSGPLSTDPVVKVFYGQAGTTLARGGTTSATIYISGSPYTYYTSWWTLDATFQTKMYRGGRTSAADLSPTVLGNGGYAFATVENAINNQRLGNGTGSPQPVYYITVTSGEIENGAMKPLGGATAAPTVLADGVAGTAAMTRYANATFTAGAVVAADAVNTVIKRAAAFGSWVFSAVGRLDSLTRNTVVDPSTNVAVSSTASQVLTWHGDGFTLLPDGVKRNCSIANFYAYCLFPVGANVLPEFGFNQALSGALVTVSVWNNGVYTPFTRASAGTSTKLTDCCTAFSVNAFNILSNQTGVFYPKNCCVSPEDQTLVVTFTPRAPYVLRGWATQTLRPAVPAVLSSSGVYSVLASAMNGLHVYVASTAEAFGLIVRETLVSDTLPSGFSAEPVTECALDKVVYSAEPILITRNAATPFVTVAEFTEDALSLAAKATVPGAMPAVLANTGAGFAEYTAGALACNATEYGTYPVYIPVYKQAASNLALDVSLAGSALASGVILSARQGSADIADEGDTLPLADAPCWCGTLAKGLPVVIEISLGFSDGVADTDVAFSVTGIPNATVTWAYSQVYSTKIATLSFSLVDVEPGDAAVVLRGDQIINVTALTPEVSLESSTTPRALTYTLTGAFPDASSPVFGGISINNEFTPGDPLSTLDVSIVRVAGYTPHRVEVVVGSTVRGVRYVTADETNFTFPAGLQDADEVDGAVPAVTVRLVVRADVCAAPIVVGAIPSIDNGLFSAPITNLTDTDSGLFHVGDSVKLIVAPASRNAEVFPGLAVFGVTYNGSEVVIGESEVTSGVYDTIRVPLDNSGTHIFAVAMAGSVVLATKEDGGAAFPASGTLAAPPTIAVTGATVVRDSTTYYRLGSTVTLTVPPVTDSKTAIYIRHETTLLAEGFDDVTLADYAYAETLALTLQGNDTMTVFYAVGVEHPWVALAVFDYSAGVYVTTNRPVCAITAIAPHILGPNVAFTSTKPTDLNPPDVLTPPAIGYWDAVNVVAQISTDGKLPAVRVAVNSPTVPYLLERWNGSIWRPANAGASGITLADTTFFRLSRGYRTDQTVTFTVDTAVDTDDTPLVQRPNVSALITGYWDYTGAPPFSQLVPKGFSVALFAFNVTGYRFKEWRYTEDDSVAASSQACQIDVGLADVSVYPVYEESDGAYADVMVLSGGADTEEGLWVSKEFRAQFPWSPVTAVVVRGVHAGLCRLIVRNGRAQRTVREDIVSDDIDNVAITISDDGMRRIPTPQGGMSRFHRVAILATDGEVSSVAVATGAQTLKGGH